MDLKSFLEAYALSAGAMHPYGHVEAGDRKDNPVKIDYKNLIEKWDTRKGGNSAQTDLHGGGFEMQDKLSGLSNSPDLSLSNAIYKLLYLMGSYKFGSGIGEGDIKAMQRTSGNKYVPEIIAATALSDLYKSQNPTADWSLGFTTLNGGTPGLIFNKRF